MDPTPEQRDIIDLFGGGFRLAVEAGAGTGKTTTLKLIGQSTPARGRYLAFNTSIVGEAKRKMPRNVTAATMHSVAYRKVGHRFSHRLESERMASHRLARILDIDPIMVDYGGQKKVLQPAKLAGYTMKAITAFCFSADPEPLPLHVPYIKGIDPPDPISGRHTYVNNEMVAEELRPALQAAWADLQRIDGQLPFRHDHYLKMMQLGECQLGASFLLFDEAQDAAPVMMSIVEQQEDTQVVYVGDSQQQIYGWRGAVNALARVDVDAVAYLTQSFRFGPAIAEIANAVLAHLQAPLRLAGFDRVQSTVGPSMRPTAILCRTNSLAVSTMLDLQRERKNPHLIGGGEEVASFARAAGELMTTGSTWHHELACFDSWGQVQEYVAQDPQGDELKLLVGLVDEYGVDTILEALERMPEEKNADTIVSTAHKAKGREWSSVQLANDFPEGTDEAVEEWRLLYVAVTRAQHHLDIDSCEAIKSLLRPAPVQ